MRRRRINLTKEFMSKWFVKARRRFIKIVKNFYDLPPLYINEEYD
jgi:hypothetical protein